MELGSGATGSVTGETPTGAVTTPDTALPPSPRPLSPLMSLVAIPLQIVSGVLGALGLAPAAVPGTPVSPITKLLELAWVALRRVDSFLFNATPTATVSLQQPTAVGVVAGRVIGHDPDGDELVYRVIEGPAHGTVELADDGSFVYTPTPGASAPAGTDSFRVSVVDKGFHFHGLLGLFKPAGGHGTVATVTVDVAPGNAAPVITQLGTDVSYSDGRIVGRVRITDDGEDPLIVTVTQPEPELGQVTIAQRDDDTWEWTLTPDRQDLPQDIPVTFTITASDGQATATLPLSVVIPRQSTIVVDSTTIHLPPTVLVSDVAPSVVTLPDSTVVTWNNNLYVLNPRGDIASTLTLPPGAVVTASTQLTNEFVLVSPNGTVNIATIDGAQIAIDPTGITLSGPVTNLVTVNGSLSLGGSLVVSSGNNLSVHGSGQEPLVVSGLDNDPFEKIVVTGDNTVVATSTHRMSPLGVLFDLGARAVLSDETPPAPAPTVVVGEPVDFGTGVIGKIAATENSVFVTVTDNGVTRLMKYDVGQYYNANGEMSVELVEQSQLVLGGSVDSLAVSEDGSWAYVADHTAGTVRIVEIQEAYYGMDVIETIHTGPGYVSTLDAGRFAVADPARGTVTIVQLD